jgi:toxin CcdB
MAWLDVWIPRNSRTRGLLVEVQSDLHAAALPTRLCAPLIPAAALSRIFAILNPVFEVAGGRYVMVTQAIAPYDKDRLARWVGNLAEHEDQIIKAIDHLLLGT